MNRPDEHWMRRAVQLSKRGFPAPNPHVGCVIVAGGEIVGEGFHARAGEDHAEVAALKRAGLRAQGATAYVTLEPCNHTGRTGPCSLALIRAGIRRVVFAVPDPNPVATGGAETLRDAGIDVLSHVLEQEARAENWQFLRSQAMGRPCFTVKSAVSLDGFTALPNGKSQWITGEAARKDAQRWRARCGAVLVGRRTVELDNPKLTVRTGDAVNPPLRVVLDPSARLTGGYHVFDASAPTLHVTGPIDLAELAGQLFQQGVRGVLVEGGAQTTSQLIRAGLADRLILYQAPILLGAGASWFRTEEISEVEQAVRLIPAGSRRFGRDQRSIFWFDR